MSRRIGRFVLSRRTVESDQETAMAIMGRCIVVRCEMKYATDNFCYDALSPDFALIAVGTIVPEYTVVISNHGKTITFQRIVG